MLRTMVRLVPAGQPGSISQPIQLGEEQTKQLVTLCDSAGRNMKHEGLQMLPTYSAACGKFLRTVSRIKMDHAAAHELLSRDGFCMSQTPQRTPAVGGNPAEVSMYNALVHLSCIYSLDSTMSSIMSSTMSSCRSVCGYAKKVCMKGAGRTKRTHLCRLRWRALHRAKRPLVKESQKRHNS
jgi:hypothetical protein